MWKIVVVALAVAMAVSEARRRDHSPSEENVWSGRDRSEEQSNWFDENVLKRQKPGPVQKWLKNGKFVDFDEARAWGYAEALNLSKYFKDNNPVPRIPPATTSFIARAGGASGIDMQFYQDRALKFATQYLWLVYSARYGLKLTDQQLSDAKETYAKYRFDSQDIKGKASVIADAPITDLLAVCQKWAAEGALKSDQLLEITTALKGFSGQLGNTDVATNLGDGTYLIGTISTINLQLSYKDVNPHGSMMFVLKRFKFQSSVDIKYKTTTQCYVFGLYCKTDVEVTKADHIVSAKEGTDLYNYLKYTTNVFFEDQVKPTLEMLKEYTDQYQGFLPKAYLNAWKKVHDNPDKKIDEVLPTSPFNISSFNILDV